MCQILVMCWWPDRKHNIKTFFQITAEMFPSFCPPSACLSPHDDDDDELNITKNTYRHKR